MTITKFIKNKISDFVLVSNKKGIYKFIFDGIKPQNYTLRLVCENNKYCYVKIDNNLFLFIKTKKPEKSIIVFLVDENTNKDEFCDTIKLKHSIFVTFNYDYENKLTSHILELRESDVPGFDSLDALMDIFNSVYLVIAKKVNYNIRIKLHDTYCINDTPVLFFYLIKYGKSLYSRYGAVMIDENSIPINTKNFIKKIGNIRFNGKFIKEHVEEIFFNNDDMDEAKKFLNEIMESDKKVKIKFNHIDLNDNLPCICYNPFMCIKWDDGELSLEKHSSMIKEKITIKNILLSDLVEFITDDLNNFMIGL